MGIYGVIDDVRFESGGTSPNLIRISGVFIVAAPMSSGEYIETLQREFLYFRIPAGMEKAALKEWAELKPFAGTGQVIGFAFDRTGYGASIEYSSWIWAEFVYTAHGLH